MGIIYGIDELTDRHENYLVIKSDVIESVDVCIIGSGAAGAVLAKELVESGKKVVLLERGGYYEGKDMNQREVDMMPLLWKNGGFNFVDSLRVAVAQGCCLGGSTIINDAVCFDTPPRVREEWKRLGVNFSDDEWSYHLDRVNSNLHVSEVSDDELNRNNLMLKTGAEKLGLREHRKNHRNCVNCMQCGFCHIGCHYETKQNVLVTYIYEALKKPDSDMRIYCNCYIQKIIQKNGIVEGVEGDFLDIDGNKRYRIRVNARLVIISAGAIASSRLLLQNKLSQETAGVGLCLHPGIEVIGDFDYEIKGNQGIPMAYTVHDFGVTRKSDQTMKEYQFEAGEFLIESIFLPLLQFSIALSASGISEHRRLIERFNNYAMAGIVVRDDNIGRVALTSAGRASITYEPGEKELKILAKGVEVLGKMWFALGARKVIISHRKLSIVENETDIPKLVDNILNDPKNLLLGSAHPQSGNKIGINQADSVVDSDCKVHGFRNLFVCDASVFPTAVGVNPQITVMAVASIIAARIIKDWKNKYDSIPLSNSLGKSCVKSQPMYCLKSNLSTLFDSIETQFDSQMLTNSSNDKANEEQEEGGGEETKWKFDSETLTIFNNYRWKGIFPRDTDIQNTLALYFGGFWKRFTKDESGGVIGTTHPFEVPIFARNKASDEKLDGFGKVILLQYQDIPYNLFYDVLKIVDENTILCKAFVGLPGSGREVLTFSLARKYPFEFMTQEDHEILYSKAKKPSSLDRMVGIWEGQLVLDSIWSDTVFRFRYYFDKDKKTLKNEYLFGGTLAGTAKVSEKEDHLEMQDATGVFHDQIRMINDNIMIGKYYSEPINLFRWLPTGLNFLHIDTSRPSIYLPYVLKRVGKESAFRNKVG